MSASSAAEVAVPDLESDGAISAGTGACRERFRVKGQTYGYSVPRIS